MKRLLAILAVCCLGGVAWALNIPNPQRGDGGAVNKPAEAAEAGKLIVHEWGTFTGFAGSDGVHLPFGISPGGDLPPFVVTRRGHALRQQVKLNDWDILSKGSGLVALQRMETPVIYFYTPEARDVSVAVDFPRGLLTEFYPPVRAMTPAFGDAPGEYYSVHREPTTRPLPREALPSKFERGSLDWGVVRIVPPGAGDARPAQLPPDVPTTPEAAAHYAYARETDAATVQFADSSGGPVHTERFLFYRGLGDFTLPVTLKAVDDERFELVNAAGDRPVGFALLLRVAEGRAQFAVYRDVAGRQSMALPSATVALDDVGDAIAHALVAEGLFEKEARAMVKTWRAHWLGEPGTRVLYTVPRATTDDLLPLRITPTPDETVRVLVGRIDVITPAQEARIGSLLAASGTSKALSADDAGFLRGLGRFYRPAMERAAQLRGVSAEAAGREVNMLRSLYHNAPRPAPPQQPAPAAAAATP